MSRPYYFDPEVARRYDAENGPEREITRDDIPFYVELARGAAAEGQPVLELGCGTGRVTIPMARTGARLTGLDSSPEMLRIARDKAASTGVHIEWVEGEMADFRLGPRFGLAVIPFRSFQLLPTTEAEKACLAAIRDSLEPGGRLAFNIFNPDVLAALAAGTDRSTRRQVERGDDGAVFTRSGRGLRVRWVFRSEMELLLEQAGFAVIALHGWFDGRPFTADSTEMVWEARRI